jgi:hypothetical protein
MRIYVRELRAKYSGAASYEQERHRDYLNHTLLVPSVRDPRWRGWRGWKVRPAGVVSHPGGPCPPILAQPQMHGLPGHPVAAGHLGDRRLGDDFHD